ncbi:MAG: murein L,D-transpeptidase [Rubrobacteridae bacterium]|nr:murein L,D-transpeptidase [Rubrobacteridae bacterium]
MNNKRQPVLEQIKTKTCSRTILMMISAVTVVTVISIGLSLGRITEAEAGATTTATTLADTTSTPVVSPTPTTSTTNTTIKKTTPTTQKKAVKPVTPITTVPPKPKIVVVKFRRNLSMGSRGDDVTYLQRKLTELGYLPGSIKGRFNSHTRHAVIAFQKVNGLKRDGIVRKATYELLAKPKAVPVRYTSGNHVEINKKMQVLIIVRDGKAKYIASTSTGSKKHTTPSVSSAVDWKAGARYVSKKYNGIMNWPSFFYGGVAVHGYASVPPYPASHGCARVPVDDAKFISNNMPKGSMVYVY